MTGLFSHRVRGFRIVELAALSCLVLLVVGVYLAKTFAGRERAEIARVERDIAGERARIRLLRAEVAHLETPERLGQLSTSHLGLAPVASDREAPTESLEEIARTRADAPPVPGAARP